MCPLNLTSRNGFSDILPLISVSNVRSLPITSATKSSVIDGSASRYPALLVAVGKGLESRPRAYEVAFIDDRPPPLILSPRATLAPISHSPVTAVK